MKAPATLQEEIARSEECAKLFPRQTKSWCAIFNYLFSTLDLPADWTDWKAEQKTARHGDYTLLMCKSKSQPDWHPFRAMWTEGQGRKVAVALIENPASMVEWTCVSLPRHASQGLSSH